MPGMPGNVSKGPILTKFLAEVNANPAKPLEFLTFYYQNPSMDSWLHQARPNPSTGAWDIFRSSGKRPKKGGGYAANAPRLHDQRHVEKHWFGNDGPSKVWWPHLHKMEDVFMEGVKQALRLCVDEPEPENPIGTRLEITKSVGATKATIKRDDNTNWNIADNTDIDLWSIKPENCGRNKVLSGNGTDTITLDSPVPEDEDGTEIGTHVYKARGTAYKLDAYWICAGTHYELVSCLNVPTDTVTLLILTPKPVFTRTHGYFGDPEDFEPDRETIWVTKAQATSGGGELPRPVPGKKKDQVVSNVRLAIQDIAEDYD